jgi:CubicO group peptidase (beta-lactamase class C family)
MTQGQRYVAACCALLLGGAALAQGPDDQHATEPALPVSQIRRVETPSDTRLIDALAAYIPAVMKAHGTPGLNIALARRGKVIWEAGFGYANLSAKRPMTPTTVFRSGSMGKTYVATAIMQLVDRGVLELDQPINRYLREFQVTNPLGDRPITVRDYLIHRTGLSANSANSQLDKPVALGEHLKRAYADSMHEHYNRTVVKLWGAKVGEKFQYSNLGMATLGYLIEVTNPERLSFSDYVQRHIIDPLGMRSTRYPPIQDSAHVGADIWARMSTGYASLGSVNVPTPVIYFADYPAGNVVSTPGEHIRLLLAYLNKGTYNGNQLLKPETVALMISPQADGFPGGKLGLTWMLFDEGKPTEAFGHGGAHMYGWHNDFKAYPKLDLAVAVATNHWRVPTTAIDREYTLIEEFITSWLRYDSALPEPDRGMNSWAWKTSYVMGLLMGDYLQGRLGIQSPVTPAMIDSMAAGARVGVEVPRPASGWDQDGFRAGLNDMLRLVMIPDSINAFVRSSRLRVSAAELEQIGKELGNGGAARLVGTR